MEENFIIKIRTKDTASSYYIIDIHGKIILNNVDEFKDYLDGLLKEEVKTFIFNFEKLEFIASIAIAKILDFKDKLDKKEGQVILCCITPMVQEIFDALDFYSLFTICDDEEEAIAKVKINNKRA